MDCESDESERWEDFFGKPHQSISLLCVWKKNKTKQKLNLYSQNWSKTACQWEIKSNKKGKVMKKSSIQHSMLCKSKNGCVLLMLT